MEKDALISAILSKDDGKVNEAKAALKEMLTAKMTTFREGAKKFTAKSIFESTVAGNPVIKDGLPNGDGDHDADDVITQGTEPGAKDQPAKGLGDVSQVNSKDGVLDQAVKALKGDKE